MTEFSFLGELIL